jgi:hypothetical protein
MFKVDIFSKPTVAEFADRVFSNRFLWTMAAKFCSYSDTEKMGVSITFDGGYVVEAWREEEEDASCDPFVHCEYGWSKLFRESIWKIPRVLSSATFAQPFIKSKYELAEAALLQALVPVQVTGKAVPKNEPWPLTAGEIETIYAACGPFYYLPPEVEKPMAQVWHRGGEEFMHLS